MISTKIIHTSTLVTMYNSPSGRCSSTIVFSLSMYNLDPKKMMFAWDFQSIASAVFQPHPSLRQHGYKQLKEKTQWNPYLLGTTTPIFGWWLVAHVWPLQVLCVVSFPVLDVANTTSASHPSDPDKPEVQLLEKTS